jgi:cold shock CspA family protein
VKKQGKIKYSDPEKGYGYILADDAKGPADTTLFEVENAAEDITELSPGTSVVFEVDGDDPAEAARQVQKA